MGRTRAANPRPILIRNSERQSFKRCRFQWALNFGIMTGTPLKPTEDGRALRFGDLIHQALAIHYKSGKKRGRKPWLAFEKLYRHQLEELEMERLNMKDEDKWLDAAELGPAMLKAFYEKYHDRDEQFEVLSAEQTFQVPIVVPELEIKLEPGMFLIMPKFEVVVVGTLDGVWRDMAGRDGEVFFKEWKTSASIDDSNLPFDEQAGTYWTYAPKWLWKHAMLRRGTYPTHIKYTFLRKAMPDERPENSDGMKLNKPTRAQVLEFYKSQGVVPKQRTVEELIEALPGAEACGDISKKQPASLSERFPVYRDHDDRVSMHKRVLDEAREMMLVRMGVLQPIKNPGPLYMPNCRGCPFRDPCELHETGNDWELMLRSSFEDWDPYAAHEIVERW